VEEGEARGGSSHNVASLSLMHLIEDVRYPRPAVAVPPIYVALASGLVAVQEGVLVRRPRGFVLVW
jgi:hypothetical protein